MLLKVIILSSLHTIVLCIENSVKEVKPYIFPVPLELPYRNERTEQCWLRVEDVELVETVAVYCFIAQAFLDKHIHDYNSRKMTEDDVDVSLWIEKPRNPDDYITPPDSNSHSIKDWRVTTVLDPITNRRLYVTKNADCRLIMYNREGMTNYLVDCEKILYYVNVRMNTSAIFSFGQNIKMILTGLFLVYLLHNINM